MVGWKRTTLQILALVVLAVIVGLALRWTRFPASNMFTRQAKAELRWIGEALSAYRYDHGVYPDDLQELEVYLPDEKPLWQRSPIPWHEYQYNGKRALMLNGVVAVRYVSNEHGDSVIWLDTTGAVFSARCYKGMVRRSSYRPAFEGVRDQDDPDAPQTGG